MLFFLNLTAGQPDLSYSVWLFLKQRSNVISYVDISYVRGQKPECFSVRFPFWAVTINVWNNVPRPCNATHSGRISEVVPTETSPRGFHRFSEKPVNGSWDMKPTGNLKTEMSANIFNIDFSFVFELSHSYFYPTYNIK